MVLFEAEVTEVPAERGIYKLWQPSHPWGELRVTLRGIIIPPRESYLGCLLSYT